MVTLSPPRVSHHSRTSSGLLALVPRQGDPAHWLLKPGRWTVGSAATCAYRLSGDGIQLRHAVLVCGPKSVVLKAWDTRTWLNGEPVCGEVRLRVGDAIKLGTITLDVMAAGTEDVLDQLAQLPEFVTVAPLKNDSVASSDVEMSIVEELRQQIHELRRDMAQAFQRPLLAATVADTPVVPDEWLEELTDMRKRVAELEQSSSADRQLSDQTQQNWNASQTQLCEARAATAEAELARQTAVAQAIAEREQLQAELDSLSLIVNQQSYQLTQLESAREAAVAQLSAEREQLQSEVESLRSTTNQQSHQLTELESAREAAVAHLRTDCEQLQSEVESLRLTTNQQSSQLTQLDSAREAAVIRLSTEREQLQSEVESLRSTVSQKSQELSVLEATRQGEAAQGHSEQERLGQKLTSVEKTATQFANELDAARATQRADVDHWSAEMNRLKQQLDESLSERTRLENELSQTAVAPAEDAEKLDIERQRQELSQSREELQATRAALLEDQNRWLSEQTDRAAEHSRLVAQQDQWQLERAEHEAVLEAARRELESAQIESSARLAEEQSLLAAAREQLEQLEQRHQTLNDECHRLETAAPTTNTESAEAEAVEESTNDSADWTESNDPWEPSQATEVVTESQPTESEWSATETVNDETVTEPAVVSSAPVIEGRPAWATSLLAETNLDDDWSLSPAKTTPAITETNSWEPQETSCIDQPPQVPAVEAPVQDLRAKLAAMFDLPGLAPPHPAEERLERDEPDTTDDSQPVAAEGDAEFVAEEFADDSVDQRPATPIMTEAAVPLSTSLSFDTDEKEDEDVDDSVTRYMQGLLARARGESANAENYSEPAPSANYLPTVPIAVATIADTTTSDDEEEDDDVVTSNVPVHQQDHHALRTATAQMRQVANLQALHNVKQHSRKRIYSAFKTKIALAAFAVLLGLGFLIVGYRGQPAFIVLGGCAMCIGVLTWIDMFVGIREGRERSAGLSKRTQANGN